MAAKKHLVHLDLNQNELQQAILQRVAGAPTPTPLEGQIWYNNTNQKPTFKNATLNLPLYQEASEVPFDNATLLLAGSPTTVQAAINTATASANINTLVRRDGSGRFKAATPADDDDVATKAYVDAARSGLDVKGSVRVATTAPLTLATDFEAGDTIDGVTLVAGDRILIKDQASGAENGIYIVQASGAPVRATDADSSDEVNAGLFTFVEEGTTNADSGWVLSTNNPIVLGTTTLTFVQFSGAGSITAGSGLTKTGNTIDVVSANSGIVINANDIELSLATNSGLEISSGLKIAATAAGNGLSLTTGVFNVNVDDSTIEIVTDALKVNDLVITAGKIADDAVTAAKINAAVAGDGLVQNSSGALDVNTGNGIEIVSDAVSVNLAAGFSGLEFNSAELRAVLDTTGGTGTPYVARKISFNVGDGVATSFALTHNFSTRDVLVQVYTAATYETVETEVVRTSTNSVTVSFNVAPTTNQYRVVVTG